MSERAEPRNLTWERLHVEDGWTMAKIGREYGVSRERVRQILRRRGVPPEVTREVQSDAAAPKERRTCVACGTEHWRKPYDIRTTCGAERCVRAVTGGRPQYSDDELLGHLRALADEVGGTPGQSQINEADGPCHTTYYDRFGTLGRAQLLAGLEPNKRGGCRP